MILSAKAEYAARALLHLALAHDRGVPVKAHDIAREQRIPPKYLEQILLSFKQQGLVRSRAGRNGGYLLAQHPREITMATVVEAADGPLTPMGCLGGDSPTNCGPATGEACALRTVWQEVGDSVVGVLAGITLEDLATRACLLAPVAALSYNI
jgi:Rrf2 family protein